jgi:hypothetical protein
MERQPKCFDPELPKSFRNLAEGQRPIWCDQNGRLWRREERRQLGLQAIGPNARHASEHSSGTPGGRTINAGVLMKQIEDLPAVVLCATLVLPCLTLRPREIRPRRTRPPGPAGWKQARRAKPPLLPFVPAHALRR